MKREMEGLPPGERPPRKRMRSAAPSENVEEMVQLQQQFPYMNLDDKVPLQGGAIDGNVVPLQGGAIDGNMEDSRHGSWTIAVHGHVKDYLDMGSGVLQLFMGSYLVHG
jgi:hypothetical protein